MYISRQEDHFSLLSVHPYLCLEVLAGIQTLKLKVLIGQWACAPHIVMAYPTSRERAKSLTPTAYTLSWYPNLENRENNNGCIIEHLLSKYTGVILIANIFIYYFQSFYETR